MKINWSEIRSVSKAERKKQRYRKIWLVPLGFLVILGLWISVSMRNFTQKDLAKGYQYLFYQLSLLNAIFIPVMLAVIASRLCDMEIKGNTLKLLYTLEQPGRFFDFKFLAEVKYLLCFSSGEILVILLLGKLFRVTEPVRLLPFMEHFFCHFLYRSGIAKLPAFIIPDVRQSDPFPLRGPGGKLSGAVLHVPSKSRQYIHRMGLLFSLFGSQHQLGRCSGRS